MNNSANGGASVPELVRNNPRLLILDGVCNLCSGFLYFTVRLEKEPTFRYAWVQSPAGIATLGWAGLPIERFETMVYIEDLVAYQKSTAFLKIARHLRFPWPLLCAGLIIPRSIRDWLYDRVSRNRYRLFGRREQCTMPEGEIRDRFVE